MINDQKSNLILLYIYIAAMDAKRSSAGLCLVWDTCSLSDTNFLGKLHIDLLGVCCSRSSFQRVIVLHDGVWGMIGSFEWVDLCGGKNRVATQNQHNQIWCLIYEFNILCYPIARYCLIAYHDYQIIKINM